jgi:hypothetical protein
MPQSVSLSCFPFYTLCNYSLLLCTEQNFYITDILRVFAGMVDDEGELDRAAFYRGFHHFQPRDGAVDPLVLKAVLDQLYTVFGKHYCGRL